VLTGELYVTVEDNALPEDSRDVHRVLLTESWNRKDPLLAMRSTLERNLGQQYVFGFLRIDRERSGPTTGTRWILSRL
jgi:hypothetical protein